MFGPPGWRSEGRAFARLSRDLHATGFSACRCRTVGSARLGVILRRLRHLGQAFHRYIAPWHAGGPPRPQGGDPATSRAVTAVGMGWAAGSPWAALAGDARMCCERIGVAHRWRRRPSCACSSARLALRHSAPHQDTLDQLVLGHAVQQALAGIGHVDLVLVPPAMGLPVAQPE
jgi:hypothetical protein